MTHFKFMNDIDKNINIAGNKNLFYAAGQGHDLLFFIRLKDLSKYADRESLAKKLARNNFSKLVSHWQEEILKSNDKDLEIMLYGYIAHHVLDSYIHPFVDQVCGVFKKDDKNTWKYNGKHALFESIFDYYLWNPYKHKIAKSSVTNVTKKSLNKIFYDIYKIDNIGNIMGEGLQNMTGFIRLYRLDYLGIKRFGYKILDKISKENSQKYTFLAFKYPKKDIEEVVNRYGHDFNKLYQEALAQSIKIIKEIKKSLDNKKIVDIKYDKPAI